jgi:Tol biopolymer transport system component
MTERLQRLLWTILLVVALALSAATIYLFTLSRRDAGVPAAALRLVYMVSGPRTSNLFSCDLEGNGVRQLTKGTDFNSFPAFHPATSDSGGEGLLAYLRLHWDNSNQAGARGEVCLLPVQGGEPAAVQGNVQRLWFATPSWSPDGNELLFGAVEDLNGDGQMTMDEMGIYRVGIATAQPRRVANTPGEIWKLSWSPVNPLALATFVRAEGVQSSLFDMETGQSLRDGAASAACWSPDGSTIAAYLEDDGMIYLLQADGTEVGALDPPPGRVIDLTWAPWWPEGTGPSHSRLFAIVELYPNTEAGPVYVRSDEPGDEAWLLLTGEQDAVYHLAVSPEGRYVAYTLATHDPRDDMWEGDLYLRDMGKTEALHVTSDYGMEGFACFVPEPSRPKP